MHSDLVTTRVTLATSNPTKRVVSRLQVEAAATSPSRRRRSVRRARSERNQLPHRRHEQGCPTQALLHIALGLRHGPWDPLIAPRQHDPHGTDLVLPPILRRRPQSRERSERDQRPDCCHALTFSRQPAIRSRSCALLLLAILRPYRMQQPHEPVAAPTGGRTQRTANPRFVSSDPKARKILSSPAHCRPKPSNPDLRRPGHAAPRGLMIGAVRHLPCVRASDAHAEFQTDRFRARDICSSAANLR
jgi:hypothetical protein